MGHYTGGDVIIAQVTSFGKGGAKLRPAIVMGSDANNDLIIIPVSSQPSTDSPVIPISLEDFMEGGLDMFSESYILLSHTCTIHPREVVGKRGRLTGEFFDQVIKRASPAIYSQRRH